MAKDHVLSMGGLLRDSGVSYHEVPCHSKLANRSRANQRQRVRRRDMAGQFGVLAEVCMRPLKVSCAFSKFPVIST